MFCFQECSSECEKGNGSFGKCLSWMVVACTLKNKSIRAKACVTGDERDE